MENLQDRVSDRFVKTRTTLLRRVNSGDKEAFAEFYDLYCPAMLKYLGLTADSKTERDQWDVVQTVFARFYKNFAQTVDPATGKRVIPHDLMKALVKTDRKTGKTVNVRFRQYLKICLKNAAWAKWRAETRAGKVDVVSIDSRVSADEEATWKDFLESQGVDSKALDLANAEGERLAAVWGIWRAVVRGFLLDSSIDEWTRDVVYQIFANGASLDDLAQKWGVRKNTIEVTRLRARKKAEKITRQIYEMMLSEDVDPEREARRLYQMVAKMKSGRCVDKFMVALAKDLLNR